MNFRYVKILLLTGIIFGITLTAYGSEPLRLNSFYNNEPWYCYYAETSKGYQTLKYGGTRAKGDCLSYINNQRIASDIKTNMCRGRTKFISKNYNGATYYCSYFKEGPRGGYVLLPKFSYKYKEVKKAGALNEERIIADIKKGGCKLMKNAPKGE